MLCSILYGVALHLDLLLSGIILGRNNTSGIILGRQNTSGMILGRNNTRQLYVVIMLSCCHVVML